MSVVGWVIVGLAGFVAVLLIALGLTLKRVGWLKDQLEEVKRAKSDLDQRMADMAATVGLLVSDDPTLDDLARLSEAAQARAGADERRDLSPVEQGAVDRILGARPVGAEGKEAR